MKNIVLLASVVVFASCGVNHDSTQSRKNTDLIQQNLKGKVEVMEEHIVNYDSTGKAKGDSSVNTTHFNPEGYITSVSGKDSSGKTTWEQAMSHNAAGFVTEMKSFKNGKPTSTVSITSNDSAYLEAKTFDSTGKQDGYYTDLKTNAYGQVFSGTEHFMNGKVKSTFESNYEDAFYVGGKSTDSTGKTSYEGTAKKNDQGFLAEEHYMTLEKDSSIMHDNTYKYGSMDEKGNWIQRTAFDGKGKQTNQVTRVITYYKD